MIATNSLLNVSLARLVHLSAKNNIHNLYLHFMSQLVPHTILNNTFLLSAGRCIFWEEQKSLILSDLHLGKIAHFRKAGIAMPQSVFKEDMQRLLSLVQFFKPAQLIIIGDMFHSDANKEHEFFLKWRNDLEHLPIHLIKGNHDILKEAWYKQAGITIHQCDLIINDFVFVHDIEDCKVPADKYVFSGHIHPGVTIKGMGKQSLHFPCFYFGKEYAVLPAFGRFTGTYGVDPKQGQSIFALVENSLVKIK